MALGEIFNFIAYAFSPAILVAPLMAISVVVSAIMSVLLLKETLNFTASAGIFLCLLGSILMVFYAPSETSTNTIKQFYSFVFQPGSHLSTNLGFLIYFAFCSILLGYIVFVLGPKYGRFRIL